MEKAPEPHEGHRRSVGIGDKPWSCHRVGCGEEEPGEAGGQIQAAGIVSQPSRSLGFGVPTASLDSAGSNLGIPWDSLLFPRLSFPWSRIPPGHPGEKGSTGNPTLSPFFPLPNIFWEVLRRGKPRGSSPWLVRIPWTPSGMLGIGKGKTPRCPGGTAAPTEIWGAGVEGCPERRERLRSGLCSRILWEFLGKQAKILPARQRGFRQG